MWQRHVGAYVRSRWPVVAAAVCALIVWRFFDVEAVEGATVEAQVSSAVGAPVSSLVWMERAGPLAAAVRGRLALALVRPAPDQQDLFVGRIRTARGRVLDVDDWINVSQTPKATEGNLVAAPPFAAVTRSMGKGRVSSVAVYDLRGTDPWSLQWPVAKRIQRGLSNWFRWRRWRGVDRLVVRWTGAPSGLSLRWDVRAKEPRLWVALRDAPPRLGAVNPVRRTASARWLQVSAPPPVPKSFVLWLVDTVRGIPAVGPGPIEWAEGRVFALKDWWRRTTYGLGWGNREAEAEPPPPPPVKIAIPPGREVGPGFAVAWPPDPLEPPVFKRLQRGEGVWVPADSDFVAHLPGAPPSVYTTYIRPDRERPYVRVRLFAMDTRQLSLHMVGGLEDPVSTTGEVGTGKLPTDPRLAARVALVFNGAFKTVHGAYGMMADRTVLLPPKDDAATVATFDDGTVAMGSWVPGVAIPPTMVSLRQNMDPLVEDGVVNPRRRYLWGFTLGDDITQMNTVRSGLCLRGDGTLVYAWGDDLTAATLGVAMNAAGCVYGMHLDMNPFHTAFVAFRYDAENPSKGVGGYTYKKLVNTRFWPDRYVRGAPKDFFFMTLRARAPLAGDGWRYAELTQPAPAFLPSVFWLRQGGVFAVAMRSDRVRDQEMSSLQAARVAQGTARLAQVAWIPEDSVDSDSSSHNGVAGQGAVSLLAHAQDRGWTYLVVGADRAVRAWLRTAGLRADRVIPGADLWVRRPAGLESPEGRPMHTLPADARVWTFDAVAPRPLGVRLETRLAPSVRPQ